MPKKVGDIIIIDGKEYTKLKEYQGERFHVTVCVATLEENQRAEKMLELRKNVEDFFRMKNRGY